MGLAALLRELPQIDPRQINAEALHDLGHVHFAQVDAERAQQVALIWREQRFQGLGIEELVDALQVGALERGADLLALAATEALELPHSFGLELQQPLILR